MLDHRNWIPQVFKMQLRVSRLCFCRLEGRCDYNSELKYW
jgi:hypothetical protein